MIEIGPGPSRYLSGKTRFEFMAEVEERVQKEFLDWARRAYAIEVLPHPTLGTLFVNGKRMGEITSITWTFGDLE